MGMVASLYRNLLGSIEVIEGRKASGTGSAGLSL